MKFARILSCFIAFHFAVATALTLLPRCHEHDAVPTASGDDKHEHCAACAALAAFSAACAAPSPLTADQMVGAWEVLTSCRSSAHVLSARSMHCRGPPSA